MKKLSIILISALVALASCTKSKEVHPEIGDGNDEIITVGMKDVHVKYTRTDHAELSRVVFHYSLAQVQQFEAAEMTKQEIFFELTLNDLLSDTLYDYYYELFYNGGESPKTEQKTFHTQAFVAPEPPEPPTPPTPPSSVPEGAINGLFSVSPSEKVYFSQGNLQYQASTNTWRFAEHQWDYVGTQTPDYNGYFGGTVNGSDNDGISQNYYGWIDLFSWGTSGYDHGSNCYQPWSTSFQLNDYHVYGGDTYNLFDQTGQADWGYNAISNGGNTENNGWRTLTGDEWNYLFNARNTLIGVRYAMATVNGVSGVVLLPDDWAASIFVLNDTNGGSYSNNIISDSDWTNILEVNGAVFFPAAGHRNQTSSNWFVSAIGKYGYYWSSSCNENNNACSMKIFENFLSFECGSPRSFGFSVRLVQDAN